MTALARGTGRAGRADGAGRVPLPLLALLGLVAAAQLVPFVVTLTTALKPTEDRSSTWLPPQGRVGWENLESAIVDGNILVSIANSAVITLVSTVLTCVIAGMAAYPLARRETAGNRLFLAGVVGMMMVPPLAILVPLYSLLGRMGAINTHWGIVLVMVTTQLPLAIFLYTAFMRRLPSSIEEAARIDGASLPQLLVRVVAPMLRPVTATVAILTSVNVWNEYALSVFILTDPAVRTVAPAISSFFSAQGTDLGAAAAAALLALVPVLIAFLLLQRQFIAGMVAGAEK